MRCSFDIQRCVGRIAAAVQCLPAPPDDGTGTVLRPQVEAQGFETLRVFFLTVAGRSLAGAEHDHAAVEHPDAQRGDARDDRPDPGSSKTRVDHTIADRGQVQVRARGNPGEVTGKGRAPGLLG